MQNNPVNQTVKDKLILLYKLQRIDSKLDDIKRLRGDSPLKVKELEDELIGLQTRINNLEKEIETLKNKIKENDLMMQEAQDLIKKYQQQQENVRNNREYDALSKEIEYQQLEIDLCKKRSKEYAELLKEKEELLAKTKEEMQEKQNDLEASKKELEEIMKETEKEEEELLERRKKIEEQIEERLVKAYNRIRRGVRNGLAVVSITENGACGGCFNKIPPQHQLDVASHKKVKVCEFCGRILVDDEIVNIVNEEMSDLD